VASRGDLTALRTAIERAIPLSAGKYNTSSYSRQTAGRVEELERHESADSAEKIAPNWRLQLGSLGSGNHFIEVSLDEQDRVWLFLHSGSRGVGNKLAQRHIKIAQALARKWWITLPDPSSPTWSREPTSSGPTSGTTTTLPRETHFGKEVWLSRKGAIDASAGRAGLIPGSMGTRSYVVVGKGNRLALNSAPHGAGRRWSRSAARKRFTRQQLDSAMQGIEWRHTDAFLDEIPDAYKPINVIMEDAKDLVEVRHTLRQIVNVKGD
jgi:tRNA-splicing ligase RtcB